MVAPAAILSGVGRSDLDELSASLFRFARQLRKELRPGRIMNAFGQTMLVGHAIDVEVFHTDDAKPSHNVMAVLVGEVGPSERDPLMDTSQRFAMLLALFGTFRKLAMPALHLCQGLFFLAEKARVLNFLSCREGRKGFQSDVNPNWLRTRGQSFRVRLTREGDVPLARRGSMDRTRLHLALDGAMIDHLDRADLGETHPIIVGDAEAALGIGETIIASLSLKPGIPRLLTRFTAAEKCLEGQVNADGNILQHLGVDGGERGALLFQEWIGGLLPVAGQALALVLIGRFPCLKQVVIEPAALFQSGLKRFELFLGRVESILKVLEHCPLFSLFYAVHSICLNCSVVKGQGVSLPIPKQGSRPSSACLEGQRLSGALRGKGDEICVLVFRVRS